jgi:hypothetical protein
MKHNFSDYPPPGGIKCLKCGLHAFNSYKTFSSFIKSVRYKFNNKNKVSYPVLFKNGHVYRIKAFSGKKLERMNCLMSFKDVMVEEIIK